VPPGYRRSKPPARPKLDPFTSIIDRNLEADRSAPPKQRHTAKRIYKRLRDEHGYVGGYTILKDYVREQQARAREVFVPLAHPPGHAQVDFGEAVAVIGGVRQAIHLFCLDLPQSDAGFVKAYPAQPHPALLTRAKARAIGKDQHTLFIAAGRNPHRLQEEAHAAICACSRCR